MLLLEILGTGPKYFQEIVDNTGLDRTIARKNLKILIKRKLVINYRDKHKSMYRLAYSGFLPLVKYGGLFGAWLQRYDELHKEEQEAIEAELEEQPYYLSDEFGDEFERLYQKYWSQMQEMYRRNPYWDKGMSIKERIRWVRKYRRIKKKERTKIFTGSIPRRKKEVERSK